MIDDSDEMKKAIGEAMKEFGLKSIGICVEINGQSLLVGKDITWEEYNRLFPDDEDDDD